MESTFNHIYFHVAMTGQFYCISRATFEAQHDSTEEEETKKHHFNIASTHRHD